MRLLFQAKILYKDVPFEDDERENIKLLIQGNVYGYLGVLLEGRERFEDESLNEMIESDSSQTGRNNFYLRLIGSFIWLWYLIHALINSVYINYFRLPTGNGDENSEKTVYSVCPRLKAFSDWLLKVMVSGNLEAIFPAASREYAPLVEELWNNAAIQATYRRRSELEMLPSIASYFLERVRSHPYVTLLGVWV